MYFFCQSGITGGPREKILQQEENQKQQTQLIYGTGPESNPGRTDVISLVCVTTFNAE